MRECYYPIANQAWQATAGAFVQTQAVDPKDETAFGLGEILASVPVSLGQLAEWTGVSRRQLSYWIRRGILTTQDGISLDTIEQIMLIKAELDGGLTLRRAVPKCSMAFTLATQALVEEETLPIGELSGRLERRVDECLSLAMALRQALPSLDEPLLRQSLRAVERARFFAAQADGAWPRGFSVVLDQFVASCVAILDATAVHPNGVLAHGGSHD